MTFQSLEKIWVFTSGLCHHKVSDYYVKGQNKLEI